MRTIVTVLVSGLAAAGLGVWAHHDYVTEHHRPGWTAVQGSVLRVQHYRDDQGDHYYATIVYLDAAGARHTVDNTYSVSTSIEDQVSLEYDPRHPGRADVLGGDDWQVPAVAAVVFAAPVVVVPLRERRRRRGQHEV